MILFYIDESYDEKLVVFTAIAVRSKLWRPTFELVKAQRRKLRADHGIFLRKELHARDFVSGRGRVSDRILYKGTRARIFREQLQHLAQQRVRLFNAVFPAGQKVRAFERLLNRLNRTLQPDVWDRQGMLICDEGNEGEFIKLARKMAVHNLIPSRYGAWPSGSQRENIPLDRLIEDPFFKDSARSYFIQLADFAAYSLLRRERPTPRILKYGLDSAFDELEPVLFKDASRADPLGIIRP